MPGETDLFILMGKNPKTALFLFIVFIATYFYGLYRFRNEADFGAQFGFPFTGMLSGIVASLSFILASVAVIILGSSLGCSIAAVGLPFLVYKAFNRLVEKEKQPNSPNPPSYESVGKVLYIKK